MIKVRQILSTTGLRLQIFGYGFGLFEVNGTNPSGLKDIAYGPIPKVSNCVVLAAGMAYMIDWEVTCKVPDMCANALMINAPVEYNYTWSIAIDEAGYTTRTIAGLIEIPATRNPLNATIPDTADAVTYWEKIATSLPILPGFRRKINKTLSDDQRTETFSIVDQEYPRNNFQPNTVRWKGRQGLYSALVQPYGWVTYFNTISATYTILRDKSKLDSLKLFLDLLQSRINKSKEKSSAIIPLSFSMDQSLDGDDISFTFVYRYTIPGGEKGAKGGKVSRDLALEQSGAWVPVPNTAWDDWKTSASGTAATPGGRGNAGLYFNPSNMAIISLCAPTQVPPNIDKPKTIADARAKSKDIDDGSDGYGFYISEIRYYGKTGVVFHKPIGSPVPQPSPSGTGGSTAPTQPPITFLGGAQAPQAPSRFSPPQQQGQVPADLIAQRTAGTVFIQLVGAALRIGGPIEPPALISYGGSTVVEVRTSFGQREMANLGTPVIFAWWDRWYRLDKVPTTPLPMPGNILLDGGTFKNNVSG